MMKNERFVYFVATLVLTACSQPPGPTPVVVKPDTSSALNNIRAAGNQFTSSVEVHPLRDPAIDGLIDQAHKLEAQQQTAPALEKVDEALKIAPNSPDLLQYQAELFVQTNNWNGAVASAQKSYELGPKVGALCAKNLQTLVEAGNAQSNATMMTDAKQKMAGCKVPAPNRF